MTLPSDHQKVLTYLVGQCDVGTCISFNPIMRATGLSRQRVRFICRHLARKGLLQFSKGLWSDDGEPRGSGYGPTEAGQEAVA